MKNAFLTILIVSVLFTFFAVTANAQMMQNENHLLELNPVEPEVPEKKFVSTPIPTTSASPSPQVKLKRLEKPSPKNISIDINTDLLSFGILSPTSPSERELKISLSGSSQTQIIYVAKTGDLLNNSNDIIPNISCDQGGCSDQIASEWINTLTFGYGYTCLSEGCDADFTQTAYRPFSNNLVSIYEATISTGEKGLVTVPIKMNVPGTQKHGFYEASITILSIPSL